jgi:hypothetical protein
MKDSYYFSHDSNARNDIKILHMRSRYGLAGYGAYWIIIEMLRESDGYKLESIVDSFVLQMYQPRRWVKRFIDDCVKVYGLLEINDGYLFSETLMNRMQHLDEIRLKRKQAIDKRWANTNVIQNDTKESKVKESKVNNKEKEIYKEKEREGLSNEEKANYKKGMDSERDWNRLKEKKENNDIGDVVDIKHAIKKTLGKE